MVQTKLLAQAERNGEVAMHWIGGQWLGSGEYRESIDPASGEVIWINDWANIHDEFEEGGFKQS